MKKSETSNTVNPAPFRLSRKTWDPPAQFAARSDSKVQNKWAHGAPPSQSKEASSEVSQHPSPPSVPNAIESKTSNTNDQKPSLPSRKTWDPPAQLAAKSGSTAQNKWSRGTPPSQREEASFRLPQYPSPTSDTVSPAPFHLSRKIWDPPAQLAEKSGSTTQNKWACGTPPSHLEETPSQIRQHTSLPLIPNPVESETSDRVDQKPLLPSHRTWDIPAQLVARADATVQNKWSRVTPSQTEETSSQVPRRPSPTSVAFDSILSLPSRKTWDPPAQPAAKAGSTTQNKWAHGISPSQTEETTFDVFDPTPFPFPRKTWDPPAQRSEKASSRVQNKWADGAPPSQSDVLSSQVLQPLLPPSSAANLMKSQTTDKTNLSTQPRNKWAIPDNVAAKARTATQRTWSGATVPSQPNHRSNTRVSEVLQLPLARSNTQASHIPKTPSASYPTKTDENSMDRSARQKRNDFKNRGSLLPERWKGDKAAGPLKPSHSQNNSKSNNFRKTNLLKKRIDVYIPSMVSVGQLAKLLKIRIERLQRVMKKSGMKEEAVYDYVLTSDYACLLAEEFGRNPIVNDEAAFDLHPPPPHADPSSLLTRPPVVTIMGHVDHGKTTLLDTLRSSAVAKGEAGGITQHIGAFSVSVPVAGSSNSSSVVTFLDTPGHAAFSAMRARGASVTDIIVLVVAADDGIMPQTKEVIELAKNDSDGVGLVVAINKVDKPGIDIEYIEQSLLDEGIQLETLGGDVPSVQVSGLTGQGLPNLLETISTMAEIQDLRAERSGMMYGCILESRVQKGLGPTATVLVRHGCLKPGSHILSGTSQAKVRVMTDSNGKPVKAAYPGTAVNVSGWKTLPKAGDDVFQGTESDVKKALANRIRQEEIEASIVDLNAINASRRQDRQTREQEKELDKRRNTITVVDDTPTGPKEVRLVIKADVSGSAEAVEGALQGMGNEVAMTKIIHTGVGDITESDVMLAKAAGATIVGFSVSVPRSVEKIAVQNDVPVCTSPIIYKVIELVREKVIELLPITVKTKIAAEAKVLQLFDVQLKNKESRKVAGCRVTNGMIEKSKLAQVVRDSAVIHQGRLSTLRYLKDEVTEVRKGSECGLSFVEEVELKEGDIIQSIERIELPGEF